MNNNHRTAPSAEEWEAMFDVLTKELLSLEEIANGDDPELWDMARAQMDDLRVTLHNMKISRGFVPGRTAKI